MTERRVGFKVAGDRVVAVDAEVPDDGPIVLQADHTWSLQKGAREDEDLKDTPADFSFAPRAYRCRRSSKEPGAGWDPALVP